jgi:hypothetical protein
MGARNIVVAGIRPIGCTLFLRSINFLVFGGNGCSNYANNLVRGFNAQAVKMINQSNQDMPRLIIVHVNTFQILYYIVVNPLKYGRLNIITVCNYMIHNYQ